MKSFLSALWFCQKEMYRSDKGLFYLSYFARIPASLTPLLSGIATKNLIDTLVADSASHIFEISQIYIFIGISIYIFIFSLFQNVINQKVDNMQQRKYISFLDISMINKVSILDLQVLENPKNLDIIDKATSGNTSNAVMQIFRSTINLIRLIIQALSTGFTLLLLNPLIPFIIIIFHGLGVGVRNKLSVEIKRVWDELTPVRRSRNRFSSYFYRASSIIEIKLFKLSDFFKNQVVTMSESMNENYSQAIKKNRWKFILFYILDSITRIGTQIYVFSQALIGKISLGSFSFYLSQVGGYTDAISQFGDNISLIYNFKLDIGDYLALKELSPIIDYSLSKKHLKTSEFDIEFKNVSFAYPAQEGQYVFKNLNLKIYHGEKIALVGLNGAGKTTFVKLLLRFYDPQEGQILINGVDLKEIDINNWYDNIGILFQEYGRYDVSVSDNVAYGNVQRIKNKKAIEFALLQSSALDFVKKYPGGKDQMLGKLFDKSIDPSGGQWQKIALSRAFFRDARILILDEPTAAIDAKAEAEIFQKVENLSEDKIVIIISHRFSTVRNADRIIVIDHGEIVEQGSHEYLLEYKGKYSELFELQAKGYK